MTDMQGASPDKAVPLPFADPSRRHLVLIAAILASALGFIDGTVLAIAMPALRESLGASLPEATWVHNGYMLTLSAFILAGGALGDKLGPARSFAAGIAGFVLASLICALAQTPLQMIAARAMQGLGAALMVPGSLTIISRAYPRAERGRAIGLWAASSALTTALGPALGGLLLSAGGPEAWRLIFAVNLPLGALAIWLVLRSTRDPAPDPAQMIDFAGAALASAALFFIALGFTQAAPLYGALGLGTAAAFVWHEARSPAPMLDLALFRSRDFSAVNAATLLLYMGFNGILFFLPMTLIAGWGLSELIVALTFAPLSVFIATLSTPVGRLADRIGPRPLITAGAALAAFGFAALGFAAGSGDFWRGILPASCLVGLGFGLLVAPLSTAVVNAVPDAHTGAASGVSNAAARVAGLMGVAALGGAAQAGYLSSGGTDSFGALSQSAGHGAAMITGFQWVSIAAVALALAAVLTAHFGMRPQASSSASQ